MVNVIVDNSFAAEALPRLLIQSQIQFKYKLLDKKTHCFEVNQEDYETVDEHINVINDWDREGEIRDMVGMNSLETLVINNTGLLICKRNNDSYITRNGESFKF